MSTEPTCLMNPRRRGVLTIQGLKSLCDNCKPRTSAAKQVAEKVEFRLFLVAQEWLCYLYPHVCAGIAVRRVDVEQIRLVYFAEGITQFRGTVFRAIHCAGRFPD